MKITKFIPPPVPTTYNLGLSYEELHELYHLMLDLYKKDSLQGTQRDFFEALRAHA